MGYEVRKAQVELYHLVDNVYQEVAANERGHYAIAPLAVELSIWHGVYQNVELPWLRWWNAEGDLLLTGEERAEQEQQKRQKLLEKLIGGLTLEQLCSLGISSD